MNEMDRGTAIRQTIYKIVAVDAVLLCAFVSLYLYPPTHSVLLLALFMPTSLIFNFLFLRHKLRAIGPSTKEEAAKARGNKTSLYRGSAIYFAGTLYGLLMFAQRQLPLTLLPALLIPLSLAIYFFRAARRISTPSANTG
jgi:hypothetical protein